MRKCSNCLREIPDDSVFCPFCGQPIIMVSGGQKYQESISPEIGRKQKDHLPKSTKKTILIVASALILVSILLFEIFRTDIIFGSFDPDSVYSRAGKGVISYNLDTNKITKDYLSEVKVARNKKDCGYVVKYSKREDSLKDQYYMRGIGKVTVSREIITVEIYDVHTGETVASRTFYAALPLSTTSTTFRVDKEDIAKWIKETLDK